MKHKSLSNEVIHTLVEARKSMNITQSRLARDLGLPQSYVSRVESGQIDLRLSSLQDLARFLNLELILIPKTSLSIVRSLVSSTDISSSDTPMYRLEDIEQDEE